MIQEFVAVHRIPNLRLTLLLFILFLVSACSSTHNLKTDGHNPLGGGFTDEEIGPGLYHLTAIGNMSPWPSFSAAIGTWRGRADQLCGKDSYQEILESRSDGYQGIAPTYVQQGLILQSPKYNSSVSGYILCNSSKMTRDTATKYLADLATQKADKLTAARRNELNELGGSSCIVSQSEASADSLYRRGKILSAMNDYKSAMNCFLRAQEQESGTNIYRESCSAIGTMYELGWGVEKNISTAMFWYHKAGF